MAIHLVLRQGHEGVIRRRRSLRQKAGNNGANSGVERRTWEISSSVRNPCNIQNQCERHMHFGVCGVGLYSCGAARPTEFGRFFAGKSSRACAAEGCTWMESISRASRIFSR